MMLVVDVVANILTVRALGRVPMAFVGWLARAHFFLLLFPL